MTIFILRRVLASIPVLVLTSVIIFFGVTITGDPLAELRLNPRLSENTVQNIVDRKHLNDPVYVQYGYWVQAALTDGFGTSLFADREIGPDLRRALGYTLQIVIVAEVIALVIAIVLGVTSAKRQYSKFDYSVTLGSFVGYSMPVFWFALILQIIVTRVFLATDVRIFYTGGVNSAVYDNFLIDRLQHLALPIIVLSLASIATYSRYMRASMLEVIHSDYVRTARAKGVRESAVTRKHATRNALIPVVTVAALNFGTVFGGAIVTETVFGIPGMGRYFIAALTTRDLYPVMAWLMTTAVLVVLFNLIADIVYGFLDPRIRYE